MTGDVADTDELLISDGGTIKRADFSVIRDAIFNDVSGDATIAGGGSLTVSSSQTNISSLLNTGLVVGRDTDNQIKFGTDNQIIFRVNGGDNVIFKPSGEITAISFTGDLTGDVTGNATGSSGSCTGNSATATKIASITNTNIVQLTGTQTLSNKTLTSPTLTGNVTVENVNFVGDIVTINDGLFIKESSVGYGGIIRMWNNNNSKYIHLQPAPASSSSSSQSRTFGHSGSHTFVCFPEFPNAGDGDNPHRIVIESSTQILSNKALSQTTSLGFTNSITFTPSTNTLTLSGLSSGGFTCDGDITAFKTSDRRFKDNIKPIVNPIEKIKKIGGYNFEWNKLGEENTNNKGKDIGVIAQEVEEVMPEIVTTRDNGYKAVQYEKIVPLLIESIKEQQIMIEELRGQIDELKTKII